jgi:adenine-specific DNA-methyltransferase
MKRFLTEVRQGVVPQTYWSWKDVGSTRNAKQELSQVMGAASGEDLFITPKPTKLVERMLQIGTELGDDDIVLDFFGGSGTTGHPVMLANSKDNGNRQFVLVQLPEPTGDPKLPTIAEITEERLRRAGKKIREENPMFAGDLGFRVFKLASSNIRAWEPNRDDLPTTLQESIEHLKTDRTEQDILFELLLKLGLDLTIPIEQKTIAGKAVHNIGAGTLLVCLAEKIASAEVEPLALGIAAWHKELAPAGETTVVFRDSAFADDVAKTNLTAILQQHGLENVRSL